jgi:hypothetical protein
VHATLNTHKKPYHDTRLYGVNYSTQRTTLYHRYSNVQPLSNQKFFKIITRCLLQAGQKNKYYLPNRTASHLNTQQIQQRQTIVQTKTFNTFRLFSTLHSSGRIGFNLHFEEDLIQLAHYLQYTHTIQHLYTTFPIIT